MSDRENEQQQDEPPSVSPEPETPFEMPGGEDIWEGDVGAPAPTADDLLG